MEYIQGVMKATSDIEVQKLTLEKHFNEKKLDLDCKYFCFVNGIFTKDIYSELRSRIPLIKHVTIFNFSLSIQRKIGRKLLIIY